MARVKRSVHGRKHHRAVLEQAKGYYGNKSRTYRAANEQLMHSMQYAFRDRRARKGDFRKLWIQRINAGARAARHELQPPDQRAAPGRRRGRPQGAGRPRRQRPRGVRRARGDRAGRAVATRRGRGRFLTQRLAFTHRRVRRLRGLLQKRSARWSERAFVAEGAGAHPRAPSRPAWPSSRCTSSPDGDRRPRRPRRSAGGRPRPGSGSSPWRRGCSNGWPTR